MVIIGIDPGTRRIGFGALETDKQKLKILACGLIPISKEARPNEALLEQRQGLSLLIQKYKPTHAAVETLLFAKNTKTAISVAQARGVIMETLISSGIAVKEFTPLQAKQAVSGYGQASKKQVQRMVQLILNLEQPPKPDDVADALALAICCAHSLK